MFATNLNYQDNYACESCVYSWKCMEVGRGKGMESPDSKHDHSGSLGLWMQTVTFRKYEKQGSTV